jgi:transposase
VVQAPAPERLIKSGIPTEAPVASVVVDKFAWHDPLYRQTQIMKLQGLALALHIFGAQSSENPKGAETPLTNAAASPQPAIALRYLRAPRAVRLFTPRQRSCQMPRL